MNRAGWLICFAFISSAYAEPDWVNEVPEEDSVYKYYVGRGSHERNETHAFREAVKDATDQAVKENFGVLANISSDSYQTERESRGVVRISERSRDVQIQNFERKGQYIDRDGTPVKVWLLFRYPKEAIRREQRRLAALEGGAEPSVAFSTAGAGGSYLHQTDIEIVTEPKGARVIVDGEIFGKTPLRVQGQIPAGPVKLLLDHPGYEPRETEVVLSPGIRARVEETLVVAKGTLQIESSPSGAEVMINGMEYGRTPLYEARLEAGKSYEVKLSHPNTDSLSQTVTVDRNVVRRLTMNLPLKPGRLVYQVEPRDAETFIDGKAMRSIASVELPPGEYEFLARREDYVARREVLQIAPGETLDLGQVSLASVSAEEKRRENAPWIFELAGGYAASPSPQFRQGGMLLSAGLEKRFFSRLTLGGRLGTGYHAGGAVNGGGDQYEHEFTYGEYAGVARVRLLGALHLGGELGRMNGRYRYTEAEGGSLVSSAATSVSQVRSGFRGYGVSMEWSAVRVEGVVREYLATGRSGVVVRMGWVSKW